MWSCYILISKNISFLNHTYTGISTDPSRRLQQHNGVKKGGAKCTRTKRPYQHLVIIENLSRSEALKMEYYIKQIGGDINKKINKIIEYIQLFKLNNSIQVLDDYFELFSKLLNNNIISIK